FSIPKPRSGLPTGWRLSRTADIAAAVPGWRITGSILHASTNVTLRIWTASEFSRSKAENRPNRPLSAQALSVKSLRVLAEAHLRFSRTIAHRRRSALRNGVLGGRERHARQQRRDEDKARDQRAAEADQQQFAHACRTRVMREGQRTKSCPRGQR